MKKIIENYSYESERNKIYPDEIVIFRGVSRLSRSVATREYEKWRKIFDDDDIFNGWFENITANK